MRKLTKVLSLLLAIMMLIPLAATAASADDASTPAPGTTLYSEDFESGKFFPFPVRANSGYTYKNLSSFQWNQGRMEDSSNHSISAIGLRTSAGDDFDVFEMIPTKAFDGVTSFTVTFDMIYYTDLSTAPDYVAGQYKWEKYLSFIFPSAATGATGNWVSVHWNALENGNTAGNTAGVSSADMAKYVGKTNTWEFKVVKGSGAQDATFSVSINGTQISTRNNAFSGSPYGMQLLLNCAICELDNIQLVNDDTHEVIYTEDFEYSGVGSFSDFYSQDSRFTNTTVYEGIRHDATGNHVLSWDTSKFDWQGDGDGQFMTSLVKEEALQGATEYTFSYDVYQIGYPYPHVDSSYTSASYFHVGYNGTPEKNIGTGSFKGIWVLFSTGSGGDKYRLLNSGETIAEVALERNSIVGHTAHYTVTYNSEAKTFKMWVNDTLLFDVDFLTYQFKNDDTRNYCLQYTLTGDIMYGVANRNYLEIDNILVTAGTPADRDLGIDFIGTQGSESVSDGKYAVRFVGGIGDAIDLTKVSEIGFKVVASFGGSEVDYYANGIGASSYVYERILGNDAGIAVAYNASDFGETYLIALSIANIPTNVGNVTFAVTPYYVTEDGTVSGLTYTVVCANGFVVSQAIA